MLVRRVAVLLDMAKHFVGVCRIAMVVELYCLISNMLLSSILVNPNIVMTCDNKRMILSFHWT
jgi:hypothetical protein